MRIKVIGVTDTLDTLPRDIPKGIKGSLKRVSIVSNT